MQSVVPDKRNRMHFGFSAHDVVVQPESSMPDFVRRDEVAIHQVTAGSLRLLMARGDGLILQTGELMISWGGVPHRADWLERDTRLVYVMLPLPWVLAWPLPSLFTQRLLASEIFRLTASEAADWGPRDLAGWVADIRDGDPDLVAITLLEIEAWLRRFARRVQAGDTAPPAQSETTLQLGEFLGFIHENRCEPIRIADVARHFGYRPSRFSQLFQELAGIGPGAYLTQCRVAEAQSLLLTTDWTLPVIAEASGFGSLSQFHTVFHAQCDMTPGVYRRTHRRR